MENPMKRLVPLALATAAIGGLAACGSDDGNTVTGAFQPVSDPPAGYADLSGEAKLTREDDGSVASLQLSGLQPDTEYVAHIHAGVCDQPDPGGPHFKFDPSGSDEPPNEIHLMFTSTGNGTGEAEASNDQRVPDGEGQSMVVHLVDSGDDGHSDAMSEGDSMQHESGAMEESGQAMGQGGAMSGDGHESHSHAPKIACADLGDGGATATTTTEQTTAKATVPTIVVRGAKPVGGVRGLEYSSGDTIRFRVRSDVADEIHVHGYDLMKDVEAGGTVSFDFPADIEGVFEVEMEDRGAQLAELRVNP